MTTFTGHLTDAQAQRPEILGPLERPPRRTGEVRDHDPHPGRRRLLVEEGCPVRGEGADAVRHEAHGDPHRGATPTLVRDLERLGLEQPRQGGGRAGEGVAGESPLRPG